MIRNPYEGIDWDRIIYVHSINHTHTFSAKRGGERWVFGKGSLDGQEVFDSMYSRGIRHFALSNYHPAKPTYPLERYFEHVPKDALGCPNAEHSLAKDPGHYCAIGSYFEARNGVIPTWKELFQQVLSHMAYDEGGGIVINHPKRTPRLTHDMLLTMLDYDPRVLGIEVYNHRSEVRPKYKKTGNAISVWDALLSTGRRVFGFFNPDYHSPWDDQTKGRNVLLVEAATEASAAKAYRQGQFYGAWIGHDLKFEKIIATKQEIHVETSNAHRIDFISDGRVVHTASGPTAACLMRGDETYVRIEAKDLSGDRIFSQPILFMR